MIDVAAIKARFDALAPFLDERGRRLVAASEAQAAGRGGVMTVAAVTGVARSTIDRGLAELDLGRDELCGRTRRVGGGRKAATDKHPGLLDALAELVQSAIRGDPEAALLWVSKSQRHLAEALGERGFAASHKLVGRLLRRLGFSLQANRKTREGANHPDRDAQFEDINAQIAAVQAAGQPAISVDTKKKELVGDFKNGGRELRPKGDPEAVRVHDFKIPELGKVAPYGSLRHRRQCWLDQSRYRSRYRRFRGREHSTLVARTRSSPLSRGHTPPDYRRLRGKQRLRVRLWKRELQTLADQTGLAITVAHHPPGTSKWNRIEHRFFAFITQNWRGKPLLTQQVIIQLIAATTTKTGLSVQCRLDENAYPKAIKVTDAEMLAINIKLADFHGEWNYTISPRNPPN